jgi:hypothetical protein
MSTLGMALVLVLRTYDLAGVPAPEMANAAQATVTVLARANIAVSWISCPRQSAGPHDRRCDEAHQPSELIVRIITGLAGSTSATLADSYVDIDGALGTFATVYVDRVRRLAATSHIDPGTLMGRVIAHEIGHLLSGTAAHSTTGLMRPAWSASMLRHDGPWAWMFSTAEAARLRARLEQRQTVSTVVRAGLIEALPPTQSPCQKRLGLTCVDAVPDGVRSIHWRHRP